MLGTDAKAKTESVDEALRRGRSQFEFRPETWNYILKSVTTAAAGIIILIGIWWLLAEIVSAIKGVSFPTPITTFQTLWNALNGAELNGATIYNHTRVSLLRWGSGYLIALVLGLMVGMVFGTTPSLYDIGMVPVHILHMIPGLAWIPVAMLVFGLGETATVFIITMTALPPIVINTAGGIRQVPKIYDRVAQMCGKTDSDTFLHVLLPGASLSIINGMRIGLANGWRVLIAAEMVVGVALGLGYSIYQSRYNLDYAAAFVCIIVICVIGLTIEKLLFSTIESKVRDRLGLEVSE
jgi:ABC-type nitrate/sulfonate/bicarbonate transport system permease component